VQSLLGQIAMGGPSMVAVKNSPRDAKALVTLLFTMGTRLRRSTLGLVALTPRIVALEDRRG
jgi:hypothetical protein